MGKRGWMRYQHLLHYAEGSFALMLVVGVILAVFGSNKIPFFLRPITGFVADKIYKAFVVPHCGEAPRLFGRNARHFAFCCWR
ncbi:bifunctional glutathione transferase/peroxidase [Podospora pseudocomata]|uniref:Bifunctional glutathione transferase/peroxidase n=1 Tax=Podospora pseudocomata TaxID=2093779 RepID=A0ABR0G5L8_9PEZI|nr:bifunctional glutathione transferase/peroxidase [Podospora pseudocomata]